MRASDIQRERVRGLILATKIDELIEVIEKLPLSDREKIVLRGITSREIVRGVVGNTAGDIMKEINITNDAKRSGNRIGSKIWTVLGRLEKSGFVQVLEGFPTRYVLNRELNPMRNFLYPYTLLEAMYDVLPEIDNCRSDLTRGFNHRRMNPSLSGTFSNNKEFLEVVVETYGRARNEILSSSETHQSIEEFPLYIYSLANALERGVQTYCLLSDETPSQRLEILKKIGAAVKVTNKETQQQNGISNILIVDGRHFVEVNKFEISNEQKIRYGSWWRNNPSICARYIKAFWEVWKDQPIP